MGSKKQNVFIKYNRHRHDSRKSPVETDTISEVSQTQPAQP